MKMNEITESTDRFADRHIGPDAKETEEMLEAIGVASMDQLIDETIPKSIRKTDDLNIPHGQSEFHYLQELKNIAAENTVARSFIGLGYNECAVPPVIQRNVFENPGWYTAYTPYQAEIAQGRLEALINFQTVVMDLTGMEIANASLLDEGTAAAEGMTLCFHQASKGRADRAFNKFFVSDNCFPQTIEVLRSRAIPLGIELVIGDHTSTKLDDSFFGVLLQYPDANGSVMDYSDFIKQIHANNGYAVVAADLLSLTLLTPPGEFGADVAVGSSQRFGVPLGYGGPHAAYFATKDEFKRQVPGRIIGASVDSHGNIAYRMALQTREQHIRREKATSNICTAQALLSVMAGMYAVYHGPKGIKAIAERIHKLASILEESLITLGYNQRNEYYFDTLLVEDNGKKKEITELAVKSNLNFRLDKDGHIGISIGETCSLDDLQAIINLFAASVGKKAPNLSDLADASKSNINPELSRSSSYLTHPVFNKYHSETEMMRYLKRLESRDLGLNISMIPLGSCTMKLNAAAELIPVSWPEFSSLHPFAPIEQTQGYAKIIKELENYLCDITGLDSCSLQPNSGAQGEFTGLMVIQAYHQEHNGGKRNLVLIPASAHGTNPASAVMAGLKVEVVACDDEGNIVVEDLREKAEKHAHDLAGLMVTYPSTHGVFEESIQEICKIIHDYGGLVYMDGANMNAQVGLTSPAIIGADVIHLNLHKTFSIPHGGGGPGMGPICVTGKLAPYLPGHPLIKMGGDKAIPSVNSAPWSSASILLISYAYIKMLGREGLTDSSKYAILNANYIKSRLESSFNVLYVGTNNKVAHELIIDCRSFKQETNIDVEDIAKRLIDYGFHAPTVSFPVAGTLMIEPTESESKEELDRFCDSLLEIRREIQEVQDGLADKEDNVLKNSPHTVAEVTSDKWTHNYSREKAAYPLPYLKEMKVWSAVGRVNNPYGDRNLVCSCPPVKSYSEALA
ncbi:MAG: aminomethyl-transferring glycine dehydrogenase [Bacteroidetes bacterium]|nr:aminomethyl-transferring glycine dehydrogenase [Bacteroidota bacterium]